MSQADWDHIKLYKEQILNGDAIASIWVAEDVQHRADDNGLNPPLTEEEIRDVLSLLENNHDACIGINWDVIDFAISSIRPSN